MILKTTLISNISEFKNDIKCYIIILYITIKKNELLYYINYTIKL